MAWFWTWRKKKLEKVFRSDCYLSLLKSFDGQELEDVVQREIDSGMIVIRLEEPEVPYIKGTLVLSGIEPRYDHER